MSSYTRLVIAPTKICDLDVSAASGLAVLGDRLYVIADDQPSLAIYTCGGESCGRVPLLPAEPPRDHAGRKVGKPDLEALALLPGGWLLALGSGSRPYRRRGAAWSAGAVTKIIDLAPLYERLAPLVPDLNIEGSAVIGERLRLLQRGNGPSRVNAVIDLDLAAVMSAIDGGRPVDGSALVSIVRVELPLLGGVPLGFTDAAPCASGGTWFAAAAEDTRDTYADGPCAGSVIGLLSADGRVEGCELISGAYKLEGVCQIASASDGTCELLLVADADDPDVPAPLLRATVRQA